MEDGLSDPVEEEAHTDTTGEEHGEPGDVIILRLIRVPTCRAGIRAGSVLSAGQSWAEWGLQGLPSFSFPYLLQYRMIMKMAHTSWDPMYSQVNLSVIHVLAWLNDFPAPTKNVT